MPRDYWLGANSPLCTPELPEDVIDPYLEEMRWLDLKIGVAHGFEPREWSELVPNQQVLDAKREQALREQLAPFVWHGDYA